MNLVALDIPTQLYLAYDGIAPDKTLMKPIGNEYGQYMLKPSGGLWTSPLMGSADSAFIQSIPQDRHWHWLGEEATRWRMEVDPSTRVLILDKKTDFRALIRKEWHRSAVLRHFEYPTDNYIVAKMLCEAPAPIDWLALSEQYDAVWARRYLPPVWDCECMVWFRWMFTDIREVKP